LILAYPHSSYFKSIPKRNISTSSSKICSTVPIFPHSSSPIFHTLYQPIAAGPTLFYHPAPSPPTHPLSPSHSAPALEPGDGRGRERGGGLLPPRRSGAPTGGPREGGGGNARRSHLIELPVRLLPPFPREVELGGEACRPALSAIWRGQAVESGVDPAR
jgi:hypothetical protein